MVVNRPVRAEKPRVPASLWRTHCAAAFLLAFLSQAPSGFTDRAEAAGNPVVAGAAKEIAATQPGGDFEQQWSKIMAAAKQEGMVAIASGGAPSRQ